MMIESQIISPIQEDLARCVFTWQAQNVLKRWISYYDNIVEETSDLSIRRVIDDALYDYRCIKTIAQLEKACSHVLNPLLKGWVCEKDFIEPYMAENGISLYKELSQLEYQTLIDKNLFVGFLTNYGDSRTYVYFGNRRLINPPSKRIILFGTDNDGLLMDCHYNQNTLKTFLKFKREAY